MKGAAIEQLCVDLTAWISLKELESLQRAVGMAKEGDSISLITERFTLELHVTKEKKYEKGAKGPVSDFHDGSPIPMPVQVPPITEELYAEVAEEQDAFLRSMDDRGLGEDWQFDFFNGD